MATLQRRKGGISGSDIVGGGEERVEDKRIRGMENGRTGTP